MVPCLLPGEGEPVIWPDAFTLEGEAIVEATAVWEGGVNEATSLREFFTLTGEWDLESHFAVSGGKLGWQWLHINPERGGTADTGDFQGFSNLESPRSLDTLYELWWEGHFLRDQLRLKVGKMDANSEFAYVESAGHLSHASAGFPPTLFPFPTYPESAFGVTAFYSLPNLAEATLSYGLFDGAHAVDGIPLGSRGPATFFSDDRSDDFFHILEAAYSSESYRFRLSYWHHTGDFETFSDTLERETSGGVGVFEKTWTHSSQATGTVFFQVGWADAAVSEVENHFALGYIREGNLFGRQEDSTGLYYTFADLSDHPNADLSENEGALEIFYRFQLASSFYVQPSIHWIQNPSGDPQIPNARVANLRLGFQF